MNELAVEWYPLSDCGACFESVSDEESTDESGFLPSDRSSSCESSVDESECPPLGGRCAPPSTMGPPKTVSICGAGHVSHYLLCALTQSSDIDVKLYAPYKA